MNTTKPRYRIYTRFIGTDEYLHCFPVANRLGTPLVERFVNRNSKQTEYIPASLLLKQIYGY